MASCVRERVGDITRLQMAGVATMHVKIIYRGTGPGRMRAPSRQRRNTWRRSLRKKSRPTRPSSMGKRRARACLEEGERSHFQAMQRVECGDTRNS
jgi:hypothetical protein